MLKTQILAPLALTVTGGVVYHIATKSVPRSIDPMLALVVLYAAALAASALVYLGFSGAHLPTGASAIHPAVVGVGLGAVMIEFGYLLIYRASWPVSTASVLINGVVAVLLIPIGMTAFGERMTAGRGAGVVLCLLGLALLRS
jgi:multidrug transporter EmrE-like cation transporter